MSRAELTQVLTQAVSELSEPASLSGLFHQHRDGYPIPSGKTLEEIIELARAIIFPGYYGKSSIDTDTIKYQIGVNVEKLCRLLSTQILAGLSFCSNSVDDSFANFTNSRQTADELATELVRRLPN